MNTERIDSSCLASSPISASDTPDVKTFRVVRPWTGGKCFEHIPGQCAMLSIPGRGRSHVFHHFLAHKRANIMEFSIKKCGCLTELAAPDGGRPADHHPRALWQRFPGGDRRSRAKISSLSPAASAWRRCARSSTTCATTAHNYGTRGRSCTVPVRRMTSWTIEEIHQRMDDGCPASNVTPDHRPRAGRLGRPCRALCPNYVKELNFGHPTRRSLICGPPIMIKFTLAGA